MIVETPYPNKALWPNGRAHWAVKNRQFQIHKHFAAVAAMSEACKGFRKGDRISIRLRVRPKPRGPMPDHDNIVSACKAALDGIAETLKIDDRYFNAPVIEFGERRKDGAFIFFLEADHG